MSAAIPRQLTVRAVLLGAILSIVLGAANAYIGLFAGLTVSASIPAAVVSMAVLGMVAKLFPFTGPTSVLENNIVQTAASAGESIAAGVIFTIPALILLDYWNVFDYWWVTAIAGLGGLLGVLFTVPLRRALIVEEALTFPEGQATAEVLKVGSDGAGVKFLVWSALAGALAKLASTGMNLWAGSAAAGAFVGKGIAYVGTNLSPALIGVGFIVRLNIATLVFAGGVISWYFAIPIYSIFFLDGNADLAARVEGLNAVDTAFTIWTTQIRYLGVGAMLVGGIWALIAMRGSLFSGIRTGLAQYKAGADATKDHRDQDTPMPFVLGGILLFTIPIFLLYSNIHEIIGLSISIPMTIVMIIAGFLFSSVAAYMAGLVGSSNNPVSGITIATILFSSLLLVMLLGRGEVAQSVGPAAAILIGAVVCCAAAIAGDNMQDLKAGYILGATPWRQQVMQGVGVISAAFFMAPVLMLLLKAYGIAEPVREGVTPLAAPQATLMASVAKGVFGGGLPWGMVAVGAGIGVAVIIVDEILKAKKAAWRAPVLAVAVGIYLPLELSVPIFLGGLIAFFVERYNAKRLSSHEERENVFRNGVLFSAGLITGEALVGILLAIPIVVTERADVLAVVDSNLGGWPGLIMLAGIMFWLYSVSKTKATAS